MQVHERTPQPSDTGKTRKPKNTKLFTGPFRIGELLVKEGLIDQKDLEKTLSLQRKELELSKDPLGLLLVKNGAMSESDLQGLLEHPELKKNIGSMAVENGLLSQDQLESCLWGKSPDELTGQFLINEGLLTSDNLKRLLKKEANAPRLGELALKKKLITKEELETALKIQKAPRMLGEILCDEGLISPMDLHYVLKKYNKHANLADILIKLGYIDQASLNKALAEEKNITDSLSEILLSKKLITSEQFQQALSKQYNLSFESLSGFSYGNEDKKSLPAIVSKKYAEKNLVLPISLNSRKLTLAFLKPEGIKAVQDLKQLYNYLDISYILITEEKFCELFEILYSAKLGEFQINEEGESDRPNSEGVDFLQIALDENIEDGQDEAPAYWDNDIEVKELVNFLIKQAIVNQASDIHLEQDLEGVKLRYRIDGVLRDTDTGWLNRKLKEKAGAVVSRIKVMSNLDIAERRLPQDGVFRINYYDKTKHQKAKIDFRVATCKAINGENVVIRILDSRKSNVALEDLNHSGHVLEPFRRLLKGSSGIILVTGPTGSGKSSTLYGALRDIYSPDIKIITAEDPIEYNFPGIMQTQVNYRIGLTFAKLLRSFLRMDPDVIFVGEIRDSETARIAFDAARTGHMVLSTLHTNDSVSSVFRLLDLGVDRSQIASSLKCVVAQRLVRRSCSLCVEEYVPNEDEWPLIFREYPSHLTFYQGKGCEACNFSGYKSRTVLSEIFVVDTEAAGALNKGADADELNILALQNGMKTMLADGLLKLRQTSLSELIRKIPHDILERFRLKYSSQNVVSLPGQTEDQHQKHTENLSLLKDCFIVSDPEKERKVIRHMYERYQILKSRAKENKAPIDCSVFGEFLNSNFQEICQRYHTKRVAFSIETMNGKVEILAAPCE
jgi:type IV pilus assembly protein PilB